MRIMDDLEMDFKAKILEEIPSGLGFIKEDGTDVNVRELFNSLRIEAMKKIHISLS